MVKGLNNSEEILKHIIIGVVAITLLSTLLFYFLNFVGQTNEYIYDDNNKYINSSLGDVDGNYKQIYLDKEKQETFYVNIYGWFSKLQNIMFIIFIVFVIFLIFIGNKTGVIKYLLDQFNN